MTTRIPTMYGRYYVLTCVWRGREFDITVFRSKLQKLQRPQAQRIAQSGYPNSKVIKYHESDPTDGPVILATEAKIKSKKKKPQVNDEDKHDAGNLPPAVNGGAIGEEAPPGREKQVKSLKKKGNKRRASFCARMTGMKKKLTSKKNCI